MEQKPKEQYNIETVKLWDFVPGAVVDEKDEEHMDFVVSNSNTMDLRRHA